MRCAPYLVTIAALAATSCGFDSGPGPVVPNSAQAPRTLATQYVTRAADAGVNEVVVLGLIHGRHRQSQTYSLAHVRQIIRAVQPDVVITEIPPDRLAAALDQFRSTGAVSEPRVKVFPEYTEVLFPLSRERSFVIEPAAAWTRAMADERRAKLAEWRVSRASDSERVKEAQDQAVETMRTEGLHDDPWGMHSGRYDELVADGMRPYDELFNDQLGAGGWANINAAHIALVEAALDRHSGAGKRILITFGAWHKYQFQRALAAREGARKDIQLVSVRSFLGPVTEARASVSDVERARSLAAVEPKPVEQKPVEIAIEQQSASADDDANILPVKNCRIVHGEKIQFTIDRWKIKPVSFPILDRMVDTLRARPSWKVRIEGHRDSRGEYIRIRITQRRANAIRKYLIAKGVAPDRLITVGYGESRPIATNKTAAGRAKNRRIEFHIEDCE